MNFIVCRTLIFVEMLYQSIIAYRLSSIMIRLAYSRFTSSAVIRSLNGLSLVEMFKLNVCNK